MVKPQLPRVHQCDLLVQTEHCGNPRRGKGAYYFCASLREGTRRCRDKLGYQRQTQNELWGMARNQNIEAEAKEARQVPVDTELVLKGQCSQGLTRHQETQCALKHWTGNRLLWNSL